MRETERAREGKRLCVCERERERPKRQRKKEERRYVPTHFLIQELK